MRSTSPHISKNHVFEAADAPEQEVPDQPMQPAKVAGEDQVREIHGKNPMEMGKDSSFAAMILLETP